MAAEPMYDPAMETEPAGKSWYEQHVEAIQALLDKPFERETMFWWDAVFPMDGATVLLRIKRSRQNNHLHAEFFRPPTAGGHGWITHDESRAEMLVSFFGLERVDPALVSFERWYVTPAERKFAQIAAEKGEDAAPFVYRDVFNKGTAHSDRLN